MPQTIVEPVKILAAAAGAALGLVSAWAARVSLRERERRAASLFVALAVVLPLPFLAAGLLDVPGADTVAVVLLSAVAVTLVALLLPIRGRMPAGDGAPPARIDERDIMFSRRLLVPGTPRFAEHYARRPEQREADDAFRREPGLLAEGSAAYDPVLFPAADASFATIERLRPFVDGDPVGERLPVDPAAIGGFLRGWGRKLGAASVGVTRLRDYHLYDIVGRGPDYGSPVTLDHPFAIALTVEMDHAMLQHAPLAPTVMESAQQYVAAGVIAVQLAELIRRLGYRARAHIDGNYRVVCPLVARDAGLGEIGRMGLLMTPALGPRVRIAVVTTDLPLTPDERRAEPSVLDFCTRCRKCADVCPAGAIPRDGRKRTAGALRWRIDSEACFTFWCRSGTDCARCVAACPYSHPDTPLHRLVRRGIRRSTLFRRMALTADDALYGRRPAPRPINGWLRVTDARSLADASAASPGDRPTAAS
jgi:ferredoxin